MKYAAACSSGAAVGRVGFGVSQASRYAIGATCLLIIVFMLYGNLYLGAAARTLVHSLVTTAPPRDWSASDATASLSRSTVRSWPFAS